MHLLLYHLYIFFADKTKTVYLLLHFLELQLAGEQLSQVHHDLQVSEISLQVLDDSFVPPVNCIPFVYRGHRMTLVSVQLWISIRVRPRQKLSEAKHLHLQVL